MTRTYLKQFDVGQKIGVKSFGFTNPQGGTGLSDWDYNPRFPEGKQAVVVIEKLWHDDETGINTICHADDDRTKAYMATNANPTDQRMFVSEFDVVWIED